MKFGIFYELQLPRPWTEDGEHKLYRDALTQVELADRVGYDYAWMVEHHFLEEYSHCPSPESFSPPPASAPKTSASDMAFCSSPPIIPHASPSASPCSIC